MDRRVIYFAAIGFGILLMIIGFFPGGLNPVWGILIAVVASVTYVINTQNDKRVTERLQEEQDAIGGKKDSPPSENQDNQE